MNGKQLALVLALVATAAVLLGQHQTSHVSEFEAWKTKHSVTFESEIENVYREKVFLDNLATVQEHNENQYRTYSQGMNQFSALTQEEFVENYLSLIVPEASSQVHSSDDGIVLGDINWAAHGAVTPVKDQKTCGSCWAFSATGAMEGLSHIAYGDLPSFSEQMLVDCAYTTYGNKGCKGGLMDNAFKFVVAKGIVEEDDYKYANKKQICKIKTGPFKISGSVSVQTCNDLANALHGQPVSVAVDATNWKNYKSGVFSNCKTSLNHGVLLVGSSDAYWLIKNSWGKTWGEEGYIRASRGNTCGVCNAASYPLK